MKSALRSLLDRFPGLKALLKRVLFTFRPPGGVSTHYESMDAAQADAEANRLRGAWQADELPLRQRELVDRQLAVYRKGGVVDVFDVLVQAVRKLPQPMAVLEVGCSSGYYSEVFDIAGLDLDYSGCDYSDAFIALARKTYPKLRFEVEDATSLSYKPASFDVVISGCCLLHIPEYSVAVAETARVARRYAVFHRTPMVLGRATQYFRKRAYGVVTVEIHFNEPQFLALLAEHGLRVIDTYTLDESVQGGVGTANRTYVCEKTSS